MDMEIFFPGNRRVAARFEGFTVETDQPVSGGGDGSAPAPFDLFLTSLATCAGIYVLRFMQQRQLAVDGSGLTLKTEHDPQTGSLAKIVMQIKLPADFPEKYRDAVVRAAEQCAVKRLLDSPPAIETIISPD